MTGIEEYAPLIEDCLAAIAKPLHALTTSLAAERDIILKTFDDSLPPSPPRAMSVIEEEADREDEEDCSDRRCHEFRHQFNSHVRELIEIHWQMDQVVDFYKSQLKEMAHELVEQAQKLKRVGEEMNDSRSSRRKKESGKSPLPEKKDEDEQLRARPAPSPFPESGCLNCLAQAQRVQTLEKQRTNWKSLSAKIDDCKRKLSAYESEIREKDSQLQSLRSKASEKQSQVKQDRDEEEKRRLKKDNTTLRGEKVLLGNQLAALKRQLADKTTLAQTQDAELARLRIELDNLNGSLSWHTATLSELRTGATQTREQQQRDVGEQIRSLLRANKSLLKVIDEQEESLVGFNEQSKQLEQGWARQSQKREKKLGELEAIVEDKNETIIRLKTGKGERGEKGGYHAEMVRVLNKRLAEREERVRVLEDSLARVQVL